jgi:ATP-dependent DNA helicase DinG
VTSDPASAAATEAAVEAAVEAATEALARVVGTLDGGEVRLGQVTMAEAVATACATDRPLVVQAGTGTGKSLAYLVPAVVLDRRVVVATASKALQDQLAAKDLPRIASVLGDVDFAVLKGRQNYVCHQKLDELLAGGELFSDGTVVTEVAEWAEVSPTGEIAELEHRFDAGTLARFVTASDECTGARCPRADDCRANAARARADAAQVVVVNQHLLAADVQADGAVLPDWDLLVVDEAHALEDVMAQALGEDVGGGRIRRVLGTATDLLADRDARGADARTAADRFADALDALEFEPRARTRRFPDGLGVDERLGGLVTALIERCNAVGAQAARASGAPETTVRAERAVKALSRLTTALARTLEPQPGDVVWVEGRAGARRVRIASLAVADRLRGYWRGRPVVCTSATVPPGLGPKVAVDVDVLRVASPFDFRAQALFYVARDLPEPGVPQWRARAAATTRRLVDAAGGRALLLFTSWAGLDETLATAFADTLPYRLLRQGEMDTHALLEAFRADETSVLAATRGFWAGIDVPGDPLRLVVIDRIPFPVPDEPLHAARRDAAGSVAFATIDVPHAATHLAQGAGRLIRTRADRGVVALMDPRLARKRYGTDLQQCLPRMGKTVSIDEAVAFLGAVGAHGGPAPG